MAQIEEKIAKKEKEFELAEALNKRVDILRQNQQQYFDNRKELMEALDELEKRFASHIQKEREFLDSLPEKVKQRIERDKEVLALRKQVLEMLKSSE